MRLGCYHFKKPINTELNFYALFFIAKLNPFIQHVGPMHTIGIDFCYEGVDTLHDLGSLVTCPLANDAHPPPVFNMTLRQALDDSSVDIMLLTSPTMDLVINTSLLALLFEERTGFLNVECIVSNAFGEDRATSTIRVCGTYTHTLQYLYTMLTIGID